MMNTINMQDMRYLNLFSKTAGVSTRYCFKHNDFIIFAVPRNLVSKAIGEGGKNVKRMSEILGKKIKVVAAPETQNEEKRFIEDIVSPVGFKDIEISAKEVVIIAGSQNKAALIGRNKRRLLELQKIAKDFLGKDLRIN